MLSYTALLTSAPGVTPTLLANLVNARAASDRNMTKADAREVGGASGAGWEGWLGRGGIALTCPGGFGEQPSAEQQQPCRNVDRKHQTLCTLLKEALPLHPTRCRQVLEHCREVYASRQARAGGEDSSSSAAAQAAATAAATTAAAKGGRAPTAREVAFRAAVNACRKRGGAALAASPGKPAAGSATPA